MAALQCEICGGKLIGKPGGVFECDSCGMEYSTDWAKAKIQEIKGTVKVEGTVEVTGKVQVEGTVNKESLLKRGFMALEDTKWNDADESFDKVLDIDPECAEVYLGKLMIELQVNKREELQNCAEPFDGSKNYEKVLRFGDVALVSKVKAANENIIARRKAAEERLASLLARTRLASSYITVSNSDTVGLRADGTVVATKYTGDQKSYCGQDNVGGWQDIVAIAAGSTHTVGLKANGTVVATKYTNYYDGYCGQCEVGSWRDIVAIAARWSYTVGLKADGTVVTVGSNSYGGCKVSGWRGIVAIAAGGVHTVGLKADGTVVAVGDNFYGSCEVSGWRDIVAIAAGDFHTVGLKADGTVVSTSKFDNEVSGWRDIVAIAAGNFDTVGLKADGTVVTTSESDDEVSGWRNIIAIAAGDNHTVGLKADGTVVATKYTGDKYDYCGQCEVSTWKLFNSIDTLEEERDAEKKAAEEQRRIARIVALNSEKISLEDERNNLSGSFTGKRCGEIEARLAEIDAELTNLNSNGQTATQFVCPNCGAYLMINQSICENCGQEIAWE